MTKRLLLCLGMAVVWMSSSSSNAGEFDRLEGADLARIAEDAGSKRQERLSIAEMASRWPPRAGR